MVSPIARLFSGIDSVKRQAVDAFNNPMDYLSMIAGRAREDTQKVVTLQDQAFGDPTNPLRITDQQAFNELTDKVSGFNFAPIGMTNKIGDEIKNKLKDLNFYSDIPNLNWLKDKISYVEEKGYNQFGYPRAFGSVTGSFKNNKILVPVDILKKIPGARGEQQNVRKESLEYLKKEMDAGQLPKLESGEDYLPFIVVDHRGKAFINEGNHRIMAAENLGFDYLPIEIKYLNGGELAESVLSPTNLAKYTLEAEKKGYSTTSYAKPQKNVKEEIVDVLNKNPFPSTTED